MDYLLIHVFRISAEFARSLCPLQIRWCKSWRIRLSRKLAGIEIERVLLVQVPRLLSLALFAINHANVFSSPPLTTADSSGASSHATMILLHPSYISRLLLDHKIPSWTRFGEPTALTQESQYRYSTLNSVSTTVFLNITRL